MAAESGTGHDTAGGIVGKSCANGPPVDRYLSELEDAAALQLVARGEDTPEAREAARLNRGWRWTLRRMVDPRHMPWCTARYSVWPGFGKCKWRRGHPGPHVNHSGTVWFDA